jgi:hypothetical protein
LQEGLKVDKDNKQVLSQLKTLVNNPKLMNNFNDYIDVQIQSQYKIMEQSNDTITLYRSQGAVATLKRLKLLREEVNGRD